MAEGIGTSIVEPRCPASALRAEVRGLLRASFNSRSTADLFMRLGHADMRVRQKAQFELVRRRDVETMLAAARVPAQSLGSIHAIWGLGQLMRTHPSDVGGRLTAFLRHDSAAFDVAEVKPFAPPLLPADMLGRAGGDLAAGG